MYRVCLLLSTILLCLLTAPASWGQLPPTNDTSGPRGNTGSGTDTLLANTEGDYNTAHGLSSLVGNTTGDFNTACGALSLLDNTTGSHNTASGAQILQLNTTGSQNTGLGSNALRDNKIGRANTASGYVALKLNHTGSVNTASGAYALRRNISGSYNTASGVSALDQNLSGSANTATGWHALEQNYNGHRNTAIGWGAGAALTSGNDNLYLGNPGASTESNTLRVGAVQTRAFIAGVTGVPITSGSQVMINSNGQLGVLSSSARYKQDIEPIGEQSEKVQQLRPVTFHYKEEPTGSLQYGLIAEEVEPIFPELVIRNADGRIEGVRYEELTPLLLNEVQRQQQKIAALEARLDRIEMAGRRVSR